MNVFINHSMIPGSSSPQRSDSDSRYITALNRKQGGNIHKESDEWTSGTYHSSGSEKKIHMQMNGFWQL